jgi:enoyl-CoA hydratase
MGLHATQTLGPTLDGLMRNTPEAHEFIERAGTEGVRAATLARDAMFGDYSAADAHGRPDPGHVIKPE